MGKRILLIQGHPDPAGNRYGHALAAAYAKGAEAAGHELRQIRVAELDFPLLRTQEEFHRGPLPEGLRASQAAIARAEHLVIFFPLWLGTLPALLKAFFEQVMRPGFAHSPEGEGGRPRMLLEGRSARIVVTLGMPALVYRGYFGAHGIKVLERSMLGFAGIAPVRTTLIGSVEALSEAKRLGWLSKMEDLGRRAR